MEDEKEKRRIEIEAQVQRLWGEQSIDLEELVHMSDEARTKALSELPESSDPKVTKVPNGSQDFLVFIDRDQALDYITDPPLTSEQSSLIAEICAAENLPCKHLSDDEIMAFKRILAGAITCAIEAAFDRAKIQLASAKDYLKKRTTERSRSWMLRSILPVIAILAVVGYLNQGLFISEPEDVKLPAWLISMYFGMLGSFFSMLHRSSKKEWDSASGYLLHLIEVIARFASGAVAGLIIAYVAASTLCPEALNGLIDADGGPQLLGFIAGFSDKLIHSFISKYKLEK